VTTLEEDGFSPLNLKTILEEDGFSPLNLKTTLDLKSREEEDADSN
jgi:hypothetical protein